MQRTSRLSHTFSVILIIFLIFSLTACPAQTPEQAKYGVDSDYYIGLKLLSQKNEKEARLKFERCVKKGSYYCAKKSAEALCTFGNIQEKNLAAENLITKFPNEKDSLLIAVKQFESANEIHKIIQNSENLDFTTDKNELIKIRLQALKKQNNSNYETEVYKWFTECPISKEHYQFYRDFYEHPEFNDDEIITDENKGDSPTCIYTPQQFIINYRIELYKRNYTYAFQNAQTVINFFDNKQIEPAGQIASDLGKAFLYGNNSFAKNGDKFKLLAQNYQDTPAAFYFWFYSGRLYDKANTYYNQAKNSFTNAVNSTQISEQKDNAIWYLLSLSLNYSVNTIIDSITAYAREWTDTEYYEDFFENLISQLLASGKWNEFKRIYQAIDGLASDDTVAQYAYIYGRLAQEGLAEGTDDEITAAFTRALNSGSSVYYKTLAAYQLGLKASELENVLCSPYAKNDYKIDVNAQLLLEGYVDFGFPELIYPNYLELNKKGLPESTYYYLADFLAKCSDAENDFGTQGLRIAARGQRMAQRNLSKEEISQLYPRHFKEIVENSCKKYDIKESVIFALIRSESFFDADVTSSAGAIGLTQLMEFTGNDIAQRLKVKEYSLTDPENNIQFGTYYLSELVRRCDGSLLQGFFSYNAGITRVRRWLKSSLIEFGKKSDMPLDLFLETLPYTETREYGRKLVSATTMYEWLYSNETDAFTKTVETLMNFNQ